MKAKDVVVIGVLLWWLLRDRESTDVSLTQSCIIPGYPDSRIQIPLGEPCPNGYEVETINETPPYVQLGGCKCS